MTRLPQKPIGHVIRAYSAPDKDLWDYTQSPSYPQLECQNDLITISLNLGHGILITWPGKGSSKINKYKFV